MNPDRAIYGRLTIGSQKHTLGHAPDLPEALRRAAVQMTKQRVSDTAVVVIELSYTKLPDSSSLDRETQLLNELKGQMLNDPHEEIYPGVNLARVHEVMLTPEYEAYVAACSPEKRIGIAPETIEQIRDDYFRAAPDCIDHFPLWVDS